MHLILSRLGLNDLLDIELERLSEEQLVAAGSGSEGHSVDCCSSNNGAFYPTPSKENIETKNRQNVDDIWLENDSETKGRRDPIGPSTQSKRFISTDHLNQSTDDFFDNTPAFSGPTSNSQTLRCPTSNSPTLRRLTANAPTLPRPTLSTTTLYPSSNSPTLLRSTSNAPTLPRPTSNTPTLPRPTCSTTTLYPPSNSPTPNAPSLPCPTSNTSGPRCLSSSESFNKRRLTSSPVFSNLPARQNQHKSPGDHQSVVADVAKTSSVHVQPLEGRSSIATDDSLRSKSCESFAVSVDHSLSDSATTNLFSDQSLVQRVATKLGRFAYDKSKSVAMSDSTNSRSSDGNQQPTSDVSRADDRELVCGELLRGTIWQSR